MLWTMLRMGQAKKDQIYELCNEFEKAVAGSSRVDRRDCQLEMAGQNSAESKVVEENAGDANKDDWSEWEWEWE